MTPHILERREEGEKMKTECRGEREGKREEGEKGKQSTTSFT